MKNLLASLAVAVLLAATAFAQAPVIDGPEKIDAYKLIDHKTASQALWEIEPAAGVDMRQSPDGKSVVWVAPPGAYKLSAIIVLIDFDKKTWTIQKAAKSVTVGTAPNPQPGPEPQPQPTPGGKLDLVLVEETAKRTPALAALVTSRDLRTYLTSKGHRWWSLDPEPAKDVPADLAGYVKLSAERFAKGLPTLFVVDRATGAVLYQGDPPKAADAVAFVKAKGG